MGFFRRSAVTNGSPRLPIGFIVPDLALVGFGLTCASFAFGSGAEAIAAILSVTAITARHRALSVSIVGLLNLSPGPLRSGLFLVSQATLANRPNRDGDHSLPRRFRTSFWGWRIAMNAEFDRDLTSEEQEQLSGGLFFRDDLPAEFVDQFQYDPAAITSWVASSRY